MTTVPNALTASINHERSPVLLTNDAEMELWPHGKPKGPLPAERMLIVQECFEKQDLAGVAA